MKRLALQNNHMMLRIGLLILAAILLGAINTQAESAVTEFESANKLYEQGKHAEAAAAYEKLLQSGHASAAVYYNLGNALLKKGEVGRAIAAFRQAQRLTPHDPDVRANLRFARNQTQGPTLAANRWQGWLNRLSLNEWTLLASSALWVCLILMAVIQWRPALKSLLRGYTLVLGLAAAVLCACLAAAIYEVRFQPVAIVVARDAVAHNGPFDESPNSFTVHDGAELAVLDRKDEWLQVSTDPRRVGWIRREQVVIAAGPG